MAAQTPEEALQNYIDLTNAKYGKTALGAAYRVARKRDAVEQAVERAEVATDPRVLAARAAASLASRLASAHAVLGLTAGDRAILLAAQGATRAPKAETKAEPKPKAEAKTKTKAELKPKAESITVQ